MPNVRLHDGDEVHVLNRQTRDSWVDEAIREAQERGAFDNLPGSGKPLEFMDNPHGADWETAFRILKNAGMAPFWIELDKIVRAELDGLVALRERTATYIAAYTASPSAESEA